MARRAGIPLELEDLDRIGHTTPVIANVRPAGQHYLMEDYFYAGGLRALMKILGDKLDRAALTVSGRTLGEGLEGAEVYRSEEHTSGLQSLMRSSYAVFCLKNKKPNST